VAKGRMLCHALEVAVDFIAFFICYCYAPTDEMVFEEAFIKLVVDIGGEALEYITVG